VRLAESLLKSRLVACASIFDNVESRYWWKGKVCRSREVLLLCKTRSGSFRRLTLEIKRVHSYEVPEIVSVPIAAMSGDYRAWMSDCLR